MTEWLTLIKYRDAGMNTYTYFWKNPRGQIQSPFFDSDNEAKEWMNEQTRRERETLSSSTEGTERN